MAYDETVAQRVRQAIEGHDGLSERKMFGGLCLMVHGNMFAGIIDDELMLRVGPAADELLARPGTRVMDFTGRPMKGYLYVEPSAFSTAQDLSDWLGHALGFVEQLPPKAARKTAKTKQV